MAVKARAEITLTSIRDVQSVTRYYLLQSSTSAVPSKPTTNPPGGDWVTSEPTYTSGSTNSLYFVDLTVFSDGTFAYSDVSLSSSYEAAKVAYNKAASAEDVANSASDKVDNLEVGGRNLLPGTETFSHWYTNYPQSITFHDGIADIAGTASAQWRFVASPSIKFSDVEGKDITVSMDIRSDDYEELATQNYPSVALYLKNRGPEACNHTYRVRSTPPTKLSDKVTSEWTRISFTHNNISVDTFTTKYAEGDAPWLSLGFWFYTKNSFQIRNIKMETGNIPTDWTPAPEDVAADITAAQETANGKNTVYYQAEAPSGGTYKTNDIWFDTNDGNKMYMWNGTAWTAETFGTAAISDLSITNAKIANATIRSAKIASLDAGKITTGTMSASRIKGDTLTLGGENNVDGMLKVYDANGTLVGSFTREGLMAITGSIGGWTIGEEDLTGEWDVGTEHWMVGLSKSYGLRFKEVPQGGDPATDWTREVQYNAGLASYSSKENSETYHGAIENYPGENGLRIYPKLIIGDHSASTVTEISTNQIDTTKVRLTELWAHPLGYGDSFYMQQPLMIMSGSTTISTGTSSKRATICAIPVEYQTGWRIIPFVTRTYGNPGATPADAGDFYYAYYNIVDHNVCIKLANVLTSGIPYVFDYMIYAVPTT